MKPTPNQTPTDPLAALLTRAQQALGRNALPEVAQLLNQAQRSHPNDPRIFMLGGVLAEKSGKTDQAIEALEHAARLAPQWWPAQLELALLLARSNRFTRALEQADQVFRLAPTQLPVLLNLVDIAHRSGDLGRAIRWLQQSLQLRPNDTLLQDYLARDLAAVGRLDEALVLWAQVLEREPQNAPARLARLEALVETQRPTEAAADVQVLLQQQPDDPVYRYYEQWTQGQTPPVQPVELLRLRFDGMAEGYDIHMVRVLGYQLPQQVAEELRSLFPARDGHLLDLGCGTGLLGLYLGPWQGAVVGVDISRPMLDRAARHGVYDKLHQVNVLDALRDTPSDQYQIITALDVFPYVGDLAQAIAHAARILTAGGIFIGSTEKADADDPAAGAERGYVLQANGRYAHHQTALQAWLEAAGFVQIELREQPLRTERGQPVVGVVITARKPA